MGPSVDLFVSRPSQWPARALASAHGWVEAIRKGWDGAGQLAGAEREGERGIGGSERRQGKARQMLRGGGVRGAAGAEDRVLGCLCWAGAPA